MYVRFIWRLPRRCSDATYRKREDFCSVRDSSVVSRLLRYTVNVLNIPFRHPIRILGGAVEGVFPGASSIGLYVFFSGFICETFAARLPFTVIMLTYFRVNVVSERDLP
jgi:hypothetical protein